MESFLIAIIMVAIITIFIFMFYLFKNRLIYVNGFFFNFFIPRIEKSAIFNYNKITITIMEYITLEHSYYETLIMKAQDRSLSLEERVNIIAEMLEINAADEANKITLLLD